MQSKPFIFGGGLERGVLQAAERGGDCLVILGDAPHAFLPRLCASSSPARRKAIRINKGWINMNWINKGRFKQ